MKIRTEFFSFRNRVVVIVVGVTLGALSLLYTNDMARRLKEKEQHDVALWAHAMERVTRDVLGGSIQDPFVADIMSNGNNIPFISRWDSSPSARRSTTSRTASGSDWPRRPPTSWEPRPRRCWDGSNTCVRRMWTRRPSRR